MGCVPSKSSNVSQYEQKRIETILSKTLESTTSADIASLKAFLKQHENDNETNKPLLLINDIQDRLVQLEGVNTEIPEISEFDLTVAKIKNEIHKMNLKLTGEKDNYMEIAKEQRKNNNESAKMYATMAVKRKNNIEKTMAILANLENQLDTLDESQASLEMVSIMKDVATTLESVRTEMGSAEDVEKLMDHLSDLQDNEFDKLIGDDVDTDVDEYLDELDKAMGEEVTKEVDLPSVPTTIHKVEKEEEVEQETKRKVAELA